MDVNDYASRLDKRGVVRSIASKLFPTAKASLQTPQDQKWNFTRKLVVL
ncbi:MAG: hypothetical protein JWP42_4652 [Pseudomonas sp.]|nr:hypothetical protein [Pseudomonas sp.]